MAAPNMYMIAGCNGAGKTTASYTILPEILDCQEYVNADEIARGLSPFKPESVAFEAGRIMLHRVRELIQSSSSFAFETTLASRTHKGIVEEAQAAGYTVSLLFFWLESVNLAQRRVKARVKEGGHHIPPDIISRRYHRGIQYLFDTYIPLVDATLFIDNSTGESILVAEKFRNEDILIYNSVIFGHLNKSYDQNGASRIQK